MEKSVCTSVKNYTEKILSKFEANGTKFVCVILSVKIEKYCSVKTALKILC